MKSSARVHRWFVAVAAPARLHEDVAGPTDDVVRGNWASDPWGRYPYRWFDGENWSALVFDGTTQYLDPFVTSIRPETPASAPVVTEATTPATKPVTTTVATPATTRMPITSPSTPAPIDTTSQSPWAPGASTGSAATTQPAAAVDRRTPATAASPSAAPRSTPTAVASATTSPRAGTAAVQPAVGSSGSGAHADKKRPIWVPVVGVVMVLGFSWWLYNLRGGEDEFAATTDDSAETADSLADAASTTTIAPATTLPVTTTTAEVASLPPPVVPDATATGLQDCIEFVPTAAYVQLPWAQELWVAAGSDAAGLPAVCAALPPEQLTDIALRRDEQELATTGSTSPTPTTVAPPVETVVPPITSADGSTVPVSPTMPPPLPTAAP